MKVIGISVGISSPQDNRTMKEFIGSEWALTPLGKLFIALAEETVWSGEYRVAASFGSEPRLTVFHPTFLSDQPLEIVEGAGILSVKDVEDALRAHFRKSWEGIQSVMSVLQNTTSSLREASNRIEVDKAKAAIVAVFPEAMAARHNHVLGTYDLSAFEGHDEQIFLARQIDGEFLHGIARIGMQPLHFYGLKERDKRSCFWEALALAFAEKELGLAEGHLYSLKIEVEEKERVWPHPAGYDPFIVREVLFQERLVGDQVVVTFGANNLPASVVRRENGAEEQVLFVSDRNSPHG